jgi:hypothetical protein
MNATFIIFLELLIWLFHELFHLTIKFLHLGISFFLGLGYHFIDLFHLVTVPLDLRLGVVTALLKENALVKHLVVLVDKDLQLGDGEVVKLILVVSAFLFEGLA